MDRKRQYLVAASYCIVALNFTLTFAFSTASGREVLLKFLLPTLSTMLAILLIAGIRTSIEHSTFLTSLAAVGPEAAFISFAVAAPSLGLRTPFRLAAGFALFVLLKWAFKSTAAESHA